MRTLRVGIIDILGKSVSKTAYSRFTRANNASIMPQVVAVWCEAEGHHVSMAYYNGYEPMAGSVPDNVDIVFINAFSQTAMLAYALSHYFRSRGAVTVIGGPHSRSYPEDAQKYFDYAVGFTTRDVIRDILQDCTPQRPLGQYLSAAKQPEHLPSVRERWKFMTPILEKARFIKLIPMIGSLGCPYTCSFCIDARVPYQPLDFDVLKADLRFIGQQKLPRSLVAWHDPNFGVRFNDYLDTIEEAVRPGSLSFIAESSLSLLTEANVKRLQHNGFKAILPGIESWFDMGNKSKTRYVNGMEKVRQVAEIANMITAYVPYMQGNFIFGLDMDEGPEPFELTKRFVDLAPGVYPHFSLLTSYGRNAPTSLEYQRTGRVLNVPFHFLNQLHAMNVRPANYTWPQLYDYIGDLYAYTFSNTALARRFKATKSMVTRLEQLFRGISSERHHKYPSHLKMRRRFDDPQVLRYFEGETLELPDFYIKPIQQDLGPLWEWLPEGAMYHDPNAFVKCLDASAVTSHADVAVD